MNTNDKSLALMRSFLAYQRYCETVSIVPTKTGYLVWVSNILKRG